MVYLYTCDIEVFFHMLILRILSKKINLGEYENDLVAKAVYEIQL